MGLGLTSRASRRPACIIPLHAPSRGSSRSCASGRPRPLEGRAGRPRRPRRSAHGLLREPPRHVWSKPRRRRSDPNDRAALALEPLEGRRLVLATLPEDEVGCVSSTCRLLALLAENAARASSGAVGRGGPRGRRARAEGRRRSGGEHAQYRPSAGGVLPRLHGVGSGLDGGDVDLPHLEHRRHPRWASLRPGRRAAAAGRHDLPREPERVFHPPARPLSRRGERSE